jgi:hypothetical protein
VVCSIDAHSEDDGPPTLRGKPKDNNGETSSKLAESESDANMSDGRGRRTSQSSTIRPKNLAAIKAVYPGLGSSKGRASEGTRNMTVETETVSSIPQSQIATMDRSTLGRPDLGGSLRMKPSTETIRPRKERKRATRKAPSINNGTYPLPRVKSSPLLILPMIMKTRVQIRLLLVHRVAFLLSVALL